MHINKFKKKNESVWWYIYQLKNKMLGCNRIFDNKHVTNLDFLEEGNIIEEAPALEWKC